MTRLSCGLVFVFCLPSCALFQPTPRVVERNYESDSITKRVKLGNDVNLNPFAFMEETSGHAKQRLLADIRRECPTFRILAEGADSGSHVESHPQINVATGRQEMTAHSVADSYLWIRYRCQR